MSFSVPNQSGEAVTITVAGNMQQALSLTTEQAKRSDMWRFIKTNGVVNYDERGLVHIHPRAAGWVEKLAVNTEGEQVKKGDLLYELYSPDLIVAQDDYLQLLSNMAATKADKFKQQGRLRLTLLGFSDVLIAQLEEQRSPFYRVPYYAPNDGVVSTLNIGEGMYIEPSNEIMTLADLSQVWVIADVFEQQMDWVKIDKWAEVDLNGLGIIGLEGKIDYIYPELDPDTRSIKVRLQFANPHLRLKPNMIASVKIFGGPKKQVINIPLEALIQTEQSNRVVIQTAQEQFVSRKVRVGMISNGRAEILSGIEEGDRVVTSGQFLLDSEASLKASLLRLGQKVAPSSHSSTPASLGNDND